MNMGTGPRDQLGLPWILVTNREESALELRRIRNPALGKATSAFGYSCRGPVAATDVVVMVSVCPIAMPAAPFSRSSVKGRDTGACELVKMRWAGRVRLGGPDPRRAIFNARSDNLERSGLWRAPFRKRRCQLQVALSAYSGVLGS